jgi:hypothetical protein
MGAAKVGHAIDNHAGRRMPGSVSTFGTLLELLEQWFADAGGSICRSGDAEVAFHTTCGDWLGLREYAGSQHKHA